MLLIISPMPNAQSISHQPLYSLSPLIYCPQVRKGDIPTPIKTKNPVQNRPKSTTALLLLSTKSSGLAHRPQIQFGRGAST